MNPSQQDQQPAQSAEQQAVARLKDASKILVTVSNNPSVDQLAAAIGLTLALNKLKKHATAVFSGSVPPVIEFLQPDKTLEKTTDSLRDFIIALDKSKADKLRYKVEDKFVKIFITPYHTSLSDKDLEFSQGDFNVEAVVALGVKKREELDQAITAHGRILHDATVICINNQPGSEIGNINVVMPSASSLSEVTVALIESVKGKETDHLFDPQIATAFLTGIVAETDRFSNEKTSPQTMSVASVLMKAGANQQLIADKLEEPVPIPPEPPKEPAPAQPQGNTAAKEQKKAPLPPPKKDDGSLTIAHEEPKQPAAPPVAEEKPPVDEDEIHIDEEGTLLRLEEMKAKEEREAAKAREQMAQSAHGHFMAPPSRGGTLTANTEPESANPDPSTDGMNLPSVEEAKAPLLSHTSRVAPSSPVPEPATPPFQPQNSQTLESIEESVDSPHINREADAVAAARQQVDNVAAQDNSDRLSPIAALNAQPIDLSVGPNSQKPQEQSSQPPSAQPSTPPPVPPPLPPDVAL